MACASVRAIGAISLSCADVAGIVDRLLQFLETGSDSVVAEALIVVRELLRRFPEAQILPNITLCRPITRFLSHFSFGHFVSPVDTAAPPPPPLLGAPLMYGLASPPAHQRVGLTWTADLLLPPASG